MNALAINQSVDFQSEAIGIKCLHNLGDIAAISQEMPPPIEPPTIAYKSYIPNFFKPFINSLAICPVWIFSIEFHL